MRTIVIAGLGNPGRQYEHTRHNAGFDVVEILSQRWSAPVKKVKHHALIAEANFGGARVVLAKPQTYMNESGRSVMDLIGWYKPAPSDLLIVYDDTDLAVGRLRLRAGGSAGTHNGMKSILYHIGRDDFPRLRVGIGRPPEGWQLSDYVLSQYQSGERQTVFDAMMRAAVCAEKWITDGVEAAQRDANVAPGAGETEKI